MQAANSSASNGTMVSKVIFVVVMLIALYYLYQFLYSPSDLQGSVVLDTVSVSNPGTPYIVKSENTTSNKLPAIYEGGEYSINTWLYINDYSINRGQNKHVLTIGGSSFSTLVVFLGPYKNSLSVRVQTRSASGVSSGTSSDTSNNLTASATQQLFTSLQSDSSLLDTNSPCDIQTIDLQKWVQVTVTLNNKTCDVYMDGKLARSCILPSFYRVDKSNLQLKMCDYNGFGGFISNTSAYNYALNPEQVWRLYMSGPGAQYTFLQYISGLFNPSAVMKFDYPKQNITS